jgi:hypothetical protein
MKIAAVPSCVIRIQRTRSGDDGAGAEKRMYSEAPRLMTPHARRNADIGGNLSRSSNGINTENLVKIIWMLHQHR